MIAKRRNGPAFAPNDWHLMTAKFRLDSTKNLIEPTGVIEQQNRQAKRMHFSVDSFLPLCCVHASSQRNKSATPRLLLWFDFVCCCCWCCCCYCGSCRYSFTYIVHTSNSKCVLHTFLHVIAIISICIFCFVLVRQRLATMPGYCCQSERSSLFLSTRPDPWAPFLLSVEGVCAAFVCCFGRASQQTSKPASQPASQCICQCTFLYSSGLISHVSGLCASRWRPSMAKVPSWPFFHP